MRAGAGVAALSRLRGHVGYPGGGHICSRTCGCVCWTYARGDDPDDPHIWGTWERKSLDTLLSIRSGSQGLGRAMYCLAKWTQRTWGIPTDRWVWVVTLRAQQREAPPNRRGPTPPRPTTLQSCPYMVAARLMALLWPGPDTPTQNYPHLTEEDMPSIKRCLFRTLIENLLQKQQGM